MQKLENEHFVVTFTDDGGVKVVMKGPGVEARIEHLRVGMLIQGGGYHPYLAHGRDSGLLVLDRELIGEARLWDGLIPSVPV